MRKIVVAEFISLDGVVEAPETWHFPYVDQEMMGIIGASAARSDTLLLGRVTYQSFAGAFANTADDDPVGAMMNRPTKVVVSKTLTELEWRNSVLLEVPDTVEAAVAKLKEQPGGDILTTGSTTLARTLLRAGLVDELSLLVHPIVVGHGERLFEADGPTMPLALVECTTLGPGVTHQVYRPA
jgi:dihydrofolate reductase